MPIKIVFAARAIIDKTEKIKQKIIICELDQNATRAIRNTGPI
jgi:hypothetical protein